MASEVKENAGGCRWKVENYWLTKKWRNERKGKEKLKEGGVKENYGPRLAGKKNL